MIGHIHQELMAHYAEDAKTTDKPWRLWQFGCTVDDEEVWLTLNCHPLWDASLMFRRKPKTHTVNIYGICLSR